MDSNLSPKKILETERLILRELTTGDFLFLFQLMHDPGWLQFIGNSRVKTIDDAKKALEKNYLNHYKTHGYGLYGVVLKSTQNLAGICGFVKRSYLPLPDLGFGFFQSITRQGFAYEASQGCLKYGINVLGLEKLLAITTDENKASLGLLKKLGFERNKPIQSPEGHTFLQLSWEKA